MKKKETGKKKVSTKNCFFKVIWISCPFQLGSKNRKTMIVSRDGELLNAHMGEIHQEELEHIAVVLGRLDAGEIDTATARSELRSL